MTRPMMPAVDDYVDLVKGLFQSRVLTNSGPLHEGLEAALAQRVGSSHLSLWNNGTTALLGALSQLELSGEVIVTPFTFPATAHAISMLGLRPVFADVTPDTFTIDPASVADRITADTSAIVGTHVYGNWCDYTALGALGREHDLRIVYDGAHSFGRKAPVFPTSPDAIGDVTMFSFHATKLFHTVEGGALVTNSAELDRAFRRARNFGIASEEEISMVGMNGKMSEFHAAMGLLSLKQLDAEVEARTLLADGYRRRLAEIPGIHVLTDDRSGQQYFAVRIEDAEYGHSRDELHLYLRSLNIVSRKYFYPLASDLPQYADALGPGGLPVAERASRECLVLPLYGDLGLDNVDRICDAIAWKARS
ncbi:DegT/DnrJ/EryC1/StrS family aminotransferase [Plantibacter flavus]|uniref:DegT/DnrJ/EryC1/StrS family aminotransferase n=1 Tax=Plantibacter flavus TaxID=150123 RepID=UPI003F136A7B